MQIERLVIGVPKTELQRLPFPDAPGKCEPEVSPAVGLSTGGCFAVRYRNQCVWNRQFLPGVVILADDSALYSHQLWKLRFKESESATTASTTTTTETVQTMIFLAFIFIWWVYNLGWTHFILDLPPIAG